MNEEYYLKSLEQANTCVAEDKYAEAIEILKPTVNKNISAIQGVISFCLGDIYRCYDGTEDNIRAKKHLSRAIEIASDSDVEDSQVVVAAKAALAQVESVLGNKEKAQQYLKEAQDEFEALPELNKWVKLKERLKNNSVKKIECLLFLSVCGQCKPSDCPSDCPPENQYCGRRSGDDCVKCA